MLTHSTEDVDSRRYLFDTVFLNDALVSHDFVYFANAVPCVNVLVTIHTPVMVVQSCLH